MTNRLKAHRGGAEPDQRARSPRDLGRRADGAVPATSRQKSRYTGSGRFHPGVASPYFAFRSLPCVGSAQSYSRRGDTERV
jgi:hypothetical protein